MVASIGLFCSIVKNVSIGTGDHPTNFISTSPFFYSRNNPFKTKIIDADYFNELREVVIGNDVWIGTNAVIKNGIKIGDGAIIGANAIVAKDVNPYSIVVGAPAKELKYRFDNDTITKIRKMEWWNWDIKN